MPDYTAKAKTLFAPRLLALMRADEDVTPKGDIGYLDGDPICDCQETTGLRLSGLRIERTAPDRLRAVARLTSTGQMRTIILHLIAREGRWSIADLRTPKSGSLAAALEKDIAAKRGHPR